MGLALALTLQGCAREGTPQSDASAGPNGSNVTRSADILENARAANSPLVIGAEWPMAAGNYANTRFSGLDQITADNVGRLKLAWTFRTGTDRGHEAAPIVVGSTMYVVTPYPNILYALDLVRPGTVLWKHEPHPSPASQGVACCDVVNRGAAYVDGRVFFNTLDGQTVAVDAESGEEIWTTRLGDINKGETMTMAPIVVKQRVIVGNSGGEFGVRGWIAGLDAATGTVAWQAYSTGPDRDVLIGGNFAPFYPQDRGEDLGVHTWPPDQWKLGGGTVWGWISYDPELDLIFHGTGNAGIWNHEVRPGDNKWSLGVFARDPDTGEARWFYQYSPHGMFDHDAVNEHVLVDLPIDGRMREVVLHPERNGFMYVLDRATGQVLSADPYVHVNAFEEVDPESGRLIVNPEKVPATGKVIREICPTSPGAKDWQPSAYSPRTGLLYVPHQNLCMDFEGVETSYIAGTPYVGANVKMYAGPGGHRGLVTAWDPIRRRKAWEIRENFPVWSGALATAGDVVFYGTMEGYFKAVDARSGELLWQHKTESGIIGQPVSYLGPDGEQYVAVLDGVGGWAGAIVAAGLDPRDPSAAKGFANAMADLPEVTSKGGTLYVFSL